MARLRCIRPFGFDKPGDEVEVPDGATYDTYYYTEAELTPVVPDAGQEED